MAVEIDDPDLERRLAVMAQRTGETIEDLVIGILSDECDRAEELSRRFDRAEAGTARRH